MKYQYEGYHTGKCGACGYAGKPVKEIECAFPGPDGPPLLCVDCKTRIGQIDRIANNVLGIRMDARLTGVPLGEGFARMDGRDRYDDSRLDEYDAIEA